MIRTPTTGAATLAMAVGVTTALLSSLAMADPAFVIKPVAERKINVLPSGPLYWQVDQCASRAAAEAVATPTSLVVDNEGTTWLFTLGTAGLPALCPKKAAEIGPVEPPAAPEYLLRINHATAAPGAKTPIHSHPGSEAFYVLAGELSQATPEGAVRVAAGHSMNGHRANMPMQVSSSGGTDLDALVMFVVDATRPFSVPATLP